jgi:hypothetical protein
MDKGQAHALLNQVKLGMYVSQGKINEALYTTGDLDVHKIAPRPCQTLRSNGLESCYVRSSSLEDEGIGGGFKWSVDWNRKRNSSEAGGIEK